MQARQREFVATVTTLLEPIGMHTKQRHVGIAQNCRQEIRHPVERIGLEVGDRDMVQRGFVLDEIEARPCHPPEVSAPHVEAGDIFEFIGFCLVQGTKDCTCYSVTGNMAGQFTADLPSSRILIAR